jgi:hypothetical protein
MADLICKMKTGHAPEQKLAFILFLRRLSETAYNQGRAAASIAPCSPVERRYAPHMPRNRIMNGGYGNADQSGD